MGATSIWHWIILLVIVVLLFGSGRISNVMGDVAKGIKSFKKGLSDDDDAAKADGKAIDSSSPAAKVDAERTKTG